MILGGIKMFEKKYKVKDLFVAYAGMISANRERNEIYFNESRTH